MLPDRRSAVHKIIPSGGAAFLLFVISVLSAAAQTPTSGGFKLSVQSQLVEIYLTVAKGRHLAAHMTDSDFQITEDGMPVSIDHLDNQDVPLQIVLLFDVSESVSDNLKHIQEAATAFIESLKLHDRVTLVLFNSKIRVFHQTTEDRKEILQEIRNAQASGTTKLYGALLLAINYLDGKSGRKAIVCFTDGEDTSGTSSRTAVMNAAAHFGYPIYMIGAGAGLEMESLKMILQDFAEVNSGKAFFIENLRKLREAFEEVAAELHSSYVINYYTKIPPDGKWHEVSIKTIEPGYEIRSRKGFFAAKK
jgi:VWFA-related protein